MAPDREAVEAVPQPRSLPANLGREAGGETRDGGGAVGGRPRPGPAGIPALQAQWEPGMGANAFSRPQTHRDALRMFVQVMCSRFDSVRQCQTLRNDPGIP